MDIDHNDDNDCDYDDDNPANTESESDADADTDSDADANTESDADADADTDQNTCCFSWAALRHVATAIFSSYHNLNLILIFNPAWIQISAT